MDGTHRTKKRAAAILLGFFAAAALMLPSAQAAERTVSELIPVGQTVGVKLFSDGVLVVGFSDGESPAKDCGLKEGDVITAIGGQSLDTIEEFRQLLELPSSNFTMQAADGKIRFLCKGQGHGLGLSQYGGNVLAKEGKSYKEILRYYFPECGVQKKDS